MSGGEGAVDAHPLYKKRSVVNGACGRVAPTSVNIGEQFGVITAQSDR
jgi:hypothetical protein